MKKIFGVILGLICIMFCFSFAWNIFLVGGVEDLHRGLTYGKGFTFVKGFVKFNLFLPTVAFSASVGPVLYFLITERRE